MKMTRSPVTVMHTHYDANGKEVCVEISVAPVFDETGEVTHIIETCRDITDSKRVVANIAYGLRASVSALRQAAAQLKHMPKDPTKWAEYIEVIGEQIDAIDRIAASVMEMAHPTHA